MLAGSARVTGRAVASSLAGFELRWAPASDPGESVSGVLADDGSFDLVDLPYRRSAKRPAVELRVQRHSDGWAARAGEADVAAFLAGGDVADARERLDAGLAGDDRKRW